MKQQTEVKYPLWVGGVQVTSKNQNDVLGDGKVSFEVKNGENILTLSDATITGYHYEQTVSAAIYVTDRNLNLTITLAGDKNTISNDAENSIYSFGSVTIAGNGKLTANGTEFGVYLEDLIVKDKADLTTSPKGIWANNSIKISDSTVTATATDSIGIGTSGILEITNSTISSTGTPVFGLMASSAKISGSTVIVTGSITSGIDINNGNLEIIDSTVTASGNTIGINQRNGEKLLIKGESTVKAKSMSEFYGAYHTGIRAVKIELDGVEIVKPTKGTINGEYIYGPNESDPSKDVEIEPAKGDYAIASGAEGTYTLDSGKDYMITVKRSVNDHRCFDHFNSVEMDGQALEKDTDYTAEKGSTIITLKAAALNRLSEGDHKITVNFDDGKVETSLTVKAAPAPTPDPTPVTPYQIPKTGVE